MRNSSRRISVLSLSLMALGLVFLPGRIQAAEAVVSCTPVGDAAFSEAWAALPHGQTVVFHCAASAGQSYRFDLAYDPADRLPGDAGSYIAIESYRINHAGMAWSDRQSEPNGNDRETVARSAEVDETWLIQVTNTAPSDAYDTSFWLSRVLLSGSD